MAKKNDNLKGMKGEELQKQLSVLQESLRVIRFKAQGSKSKNVKEYAALKKQAARILTQMNQQANRVNK